ncbi:hypothetical protein CHS0354_028195 [Potamilus streckersoni]|uniref:Uncharacterized protein n=1 Tax=Potamilus streckersoni TaxID=2493646 RepID=A0AAE0WD09_9BIVA|nr:hypothetical protein CHS0354_028195 [Potamilus streckersoni]
MLVLLKVIFKFKFAQLVQQKWKIRQGKGQIGFQIHQILFSASLEKSTGVHKKKILDDGSIYYTGLTWCLIQGHDMQGNNLDNSPE